MRLSQNKGVGYPKGGIDYKGGGMNDLWVCFLNFRNMLVQVSLMYKLRCHNFEITNFKSISFRLWVAIVGTH